MTKIPADGGDCLAGSAEQDVGQGKRMRPLLASYGGDRRA